MPRYHFDTECGDLGYKDPEGIDLEDIEEARQQLLGLIRDMTMHDDAQEPNKTVTAQVRCGGAVVLQGSRAVSITRPPIWSPKL
jgi:hypothetical protein